MAHTKEELEKLLAVKGDLIPSLQEMGDVMGVSRERVRQLLQKFGLRKAHCTKAPNPKLHCSDCGKRLGADKSRESGRCGFCRGVISPPALRLVLTCGVCGRNFSISPAQYKHRSDRSRLKNPDGTKKLPFFHSRKCWGSYAGKHYGWGSETHPHKKANRTGLLGESNISSQTVS